MKSRNLLIIFLLRSISTFGQMVAPGNTWNYIDAGPIPLCLKSTQCGGTVIHPNYKYEFSHDTLINDVKYYILVETIDFKTVYAEPRTTIKGFMREDASHKKIYFRNIWENVEYLLYDFTLQKGDVFNNAKVTSTDSVWVNGGKRLRIQFDATKYNFFNEGQPDTLKWIEGIGSTQGLIDGDVTLLCFKENGQSIFQNKYGFDCDYAIYVDVHTINKTELTVYPNPAKDILLIRSETPIQSVTLTSMSGQRIYQYSPESTIHQIDLRLFPRGLYIINVDNRFRKIVVE